jgi:hypothetical protein
MKIYWWKVKLVCTEFFLAVDGRRISGWILLEYQRGVGPTETKRI